jgi:hypothetical protein
MTAATKLADESADGLFEVLDNVENKKASVGAMRD